MLFYATKTWDNLSINIDDVYSASKIFSIHFYIYFTHNIVQVVPNFSSNSKQFRFLRSNLNIKSWNKYFKFVFNHDIEQE